LIDGTYLRSARQVVIDVVATLQEVVEINAGFRIVANTMVIVAVDRMKGRFDALGWFPRLS
jgi:hypothetical protein